MPGVTHLSFRSNFDFIFKVLHTDSKDSTVHLESAMTSFGKDIYKTFILTALLEHVAFCFLATQSCQFKSTQGARAFLKEDFADSQPALYHYNVGSICK